MPDLLQLIAEGEHQQQDFKYQISDSRKIARTISAFANTDGGRLLIGVKDNGSLVGIRSEEEIHMIEAAADFYMKPAVDLAFNKIAIDGLQILEVIIHPSKHKPHFVKEKGGKNIAYFRLNDENFPISGVLEKYWKVKKQKHKKVAYTEREAKLMTFLRENPFITVKRLAILAKISFAEAEDLLATFMSWEIIDWHFNGKFFEYFLIQD